MQVQYVQDVFGSDLDPDVIYVDAKHIWLRCLCGQHDLLLPRHSARQVWQIQDDTITPSISVGQGCFSHFWIRQGNYHTC